MNSNLALITCPCGITFPVEDRNAESLQCECPVCGLTLQADLISGLKPQGSNDEGQNELNNCQPYRDENNSDEQLSDELRLPEELMDADLLDSENQKDGPIPSSRKREAESPSDQLSKDSEARGIPLQESERDPSKGTNFPPSGSHAQTKGDSPNSRKPGSDHPAKATAKLKAKDYLTRIVCTCGKRFKVDALGKKDYRVNCPECDKKLRIGNPKSRKKTRDKKKKRRKETPVVECVCGITFKVNTLEREFTCACPGCDKILVADGSSKVKIQRPFASPDRYAGSDYGASSNRNADSNRNAGSNRDGVVMLVDPLTLSSVEKENLQKQKRKAQPTRGVFRQFVQGIPMVPLILATISVGIILLWMLGSLVQQ